MLATIMLFSTSFLYRFGEIWEEFWGVEEGFGGSLVPLERLFALIFSCLYLECSPEGLFEPSGIDFASILGG